MKRETLAWAHKAGQHLVSADTLFREGLYPQAIFLYEQAIECLLKARWIESHGAGLPPKVHDLVSLADDLPIQFDEAQTEFLRKLQDQYMPTRYADVEVEYPEDVAVVYRDETHRMFQWLQQALN